VLHKRLRLHAYKLRLRHETKYIRPHKNEVGYADSMISETDDDEDLERGEHIIDIIGHADRHSYRNWRAD
jgi:hypothetical protein